MATPINKTYTMPSGRSLYAGRYGPPSWSIGVQPRTWTQIPNTSFAVKGAEVITPPTGYRGTQPIPAIVDAYGDPIQDPNSSKLYMYGGGHYDGTCNAVVEVDTLTLGYSQKIAPTPPSCYPPSFAANGVISYPSGYAPGYFSAHLTDPLDIPYNAPMDAPGVSHQYGANAMRGDTIHFFYGKYKELNLATGQWNLSTGVDIGAKLNALNSNLKSNDLQQGTMAVYDPVTDKFLVSLVPGDDGISWRVGFFLYDPVTQVVSNIVLNAWTRSAMGLVRIGRYAYATCIKDGVSGIETVKGWRFNFDTKTVEHFITIGDVIPEASGSYMETVPANYHSGRNSLIRWNYGSEVTSLYEMALTPVAGTGTLADPYQLPQTKIQISGSAPPSVILNYRRIYYVSSADCLLFLPRASSNWYAVKL